jgi:hypothetical protein
VRFDRSRAFPSHPVRFRRTPCASIDATVWIGDDDREPFATGRFRHAGTAARYLRARGSET